MAKAGAKLTENDAAQPDAAINCEKPQEPVFNKAKILSLPRYEAFRDLLGVLLEEKPYTLSEVESSIEKFMKGGTT